MTTTLRWHGRSAADTALELDEWVEVATVHPLKNTYRRRLEAFLP